MKTRFASPFTEQNRRGFGRMVGFALLLVGMQSGCGREFYREWANQDVTEAIYEKSRDPRYRIDAFSIDPPLVARFADPYDQDRPPAPPDDFAAQATSPVPQNPDHRLIMPVEGTGYLKILDEGPRYNPPPPRPDPVAPPADPNKPVVPPPPALDPGPFNAPGTTTPMPGPGASRTNSGTGRPSMSPTSLATQGSPANPGPSATSGPRPSSATAGRLDDVVRRTSLQDPAGLMLAQTAPPQQIPQNRADSPSDRVRAPRNPNDPNPIDADITNPVLMPPPGQNAAQVQQGEDIQSRLAKMFLPEDVPFDEAIAAGYLSDSRPYVLSMEKAFQLAILNSRYYQYELENVYITALPVALQRFSFSPQFIAGLSPTTAIGGNGSSSGGLLPTQNPVNSFLYNTRGTGAQTSTLNYGTVVGVGKLFDNGAKVLASFANQLVFNFVGKNPMQPTVKSYIPIQAVIPFLRGGGRAVTLEALTQAERNLLYAIRSFALFRQQFTVATLTGGQVQTFGVSTTTQGFSTGGNIDPVIGFLNVVEDVAIVENYVKNVSVYERFAKVYQELIQGETSGLSQLQLDQVVQQVQNARIQLISSQTQYRSDLDNFKIRLGMPPDVPAIIDRSRTQKFKDVFERIDKWTLKPKHERQELELIVGDLPELEDLVVDGRSCQDVFTTDPIVNKNGPPLEDLLLSVERTALENRLDLMNARAQLYDVWRQIRVTANALKGVLNVNVTNQYLTPPTTNNPFGFVSQAKDFSLVFNAELPLVRVAERNNFRTALINYQRQRRQLQNTEDFLKYQLRQEVRQMQFYYTQYQVTKKALILAVTIKDQAFEQIVAPPQPGVANQGAVNTNNLLGAQNAIIGAENNLVTYWYQYQLYRLQVYRDLGTLPIDEWEAFDEIFPPDRSKRTGSAAIEPDGRVTSAGAAQPTQNLGPR